MHFIDVYHVNCASFHSSLLLQKLLKFEGELSMAKEMLFSVTMQPF